MLTSYTSLYQHIMHAFILFLCIEIVVVVGQGKDTNVGKLRNAADVAFSNGDSTQALNLWKQVIELEPNNDSNYYKRFRVYLRQNKLKEALTDLTSALKIKPDNDQVLGQRAKLQIKMGSCDKAEQDFLKLKQLGILLLIIIIIIIITITITTIIITITTVTNNYNST